MKTKPKTKTRTGREKKKVNGGASPGFPGLGFPAP